MFIGVASKEMNLTEYRYNMNRAMESAITVIEEAGKEYGHLFGRSYGLIDTYRSEDADIVFVVIGSMAGTVRVAVDQLRDEGKRAGMIKLWSVRPFPTERLYEAVGKSKALVIVERSTSIGSCCNSGCLYPEIASSFYRKENQPFIQPVIAGLAARRVNTADLKKIYYQTEKRSADDFIVNSAEWVNLV
jgi:pyruvate ferredoxin oxidoreductase alpha subunit